MFLWLKGKIFFVSIRVCRGDPLQTLVSIVTFWFCICRVWFLKWHFWFPKSVRLITKISFWFPKFVRRLISQMGFLSGKSVHKPARLLQFLWWITYKAFIAWLTWMSFRNFLLRYEIMGVSLKIFLSCGWLSIRCHFPMSVSFRLGNAGWVLCYKRQYFLTCSFVFLC